MNDAESASEYWNIYLKHHPNEPMGNLQMGLALMELERHSDALARLENIPEKYPDINIHRGRIHDGMNNHNKAIESYRKALSANPDSVDAHGLMGASYANQGHHRQARECFDKVIEIQLDYRGYYHRGIVLADLGRCDEAIDNYKTALDINPNHLESRINLALELSKSGRPEEAIPHFLGTLDVNLNHPDALYNLAIALMHTERYDEALDYSDRLIGLHPSDIDAKYLRALILAITGRVDKCLEILMPLAKADPDFKKTIDSVQYGEAFAPILQDKRYYDLMTTPLGNKFLKPGAFTCTTPQWHPVFFLHQPGIVPPQKYWICLHITARPSLFHLQNNDFGWPKRNALH